MPRLTKIYTKRGDAGETSLGGGQRVPKDNLRVQVYGTVDELNSQIGVALAMGLCDRLTDVLPRSRTSCSTWAPTSALSKRTRPSSPCRRSKNATLLSWRRLIDEMTTVVGPLENFILPGGTLGAAQLHVARTVCRRAEREAATLAREEGVGAYVLAYLNRLSDALFVMARFENHERGVPEPLWRPGA